MGKALKSPQMRLFFGLTVAMSLLTWIFRRSELSNLAEYSLIDIWHSTTALGSVSAECLYEERSVSKMPLECIIGYIVSA